MQRLGQPLPVKVLAARCALSPRHFTRQFREATGTTPHQWLLTQRLALAQRLLETTGQPIDQVAAIAGFGTPADEAAIPASPGHQPGGLPPDVPHPIGRLTLRAVEDAADLWFSAVGGVDSGRPPLKIDQHVVGAGELGDAPLDLGQVLADQGGHVAARRVPGITDDQDAADLGQSEPGRLSVPDERQPVEGARRVVAVTGGRAGRGGH
jgi:Helix-turn-helix domain